jgi:protein-disulfide isomerase
MQRTRYDSSSLVHGCVALALWAACACAAAPPQGSTAASASASANPNAACDDYAQRLCKELGARSEGCRSVLGTVALLPARACEVGLAEFDATLQRIAELHKACETVATSICAELGAESEGCQAIRQNLPQIPPGHCASLLRDQRQLIAALRQREALNGPISDERWQALLDGEPPGFGAASAPVTVVEFSDFQCPYCAQAAETVHRLKKDYEGRIRFVFRHFPLPFHPNAQAAAQAAFAAQEQGKFWEYHDLLFGNQDALGPEALVVYARKVGLDVEAFRSAAGSESAAQRITADMRLGESVQVQGTPTMFIDKKRIADPLDYDKVAQLVEQELHSLPAGPAPLSQPR